MNTIKEYLYELKTAMKGSDVATIQDALSDAEEYLVDALEALREQGTGISQIEAFQQVSGQYGSPKEVAAAYLEAEERLSPSFSRRKTVKKKSILTKFFGVFADPLAWGSLLFILISFVTGLVFFTWTVTGLSLSVSFLIFIFGLFFLLFFLYSLRGIALVEGKFVEALLGTRMPRRPLFAPRNYKWQEQLKLLIKDKHTWLTLVYTLLKMPLGVFLFSAVLVLITVSLSLIAVPVIWYGFPTLLPVRLSEQEVAVHAMMGVWASNWMIILYGLAGILALTVSMHAVKGLGILQAKWAKLMLVVE
jgi:uncharacterized membrane protein